MEKQNDDVVMQVNDVGGLQQLEEEEEESMEMTRKRIDELMLRIRERQKREAEESELYYFVTEEQLVDQGVKKFNMTKEQAVEAVQKMKQNSVKLCRKEIDMKDEVSRGLENLDLKAKDDRGFHYFLS